MYDKLVGVTQTESGSNYGLLENKNENGNDIKKSD